MDRYPNAQRDVPEKLVSAFYRLAPPEHGYQNKEEREHRLRMLMRRLVAQWGAETVVRLIRKHPTETLAEQETLAWLVLTAYAEEKKGQRGSSW